eukprot:scaffold50879_cov37-Prasinocladus_malaysianus.AAC.1
MPARPGSEGLEYRESAPLYRHTAVALCLRSCARSQSQVSHRGAKRDANVSSEAQSQGDKLDRSLIAVGALHLAGTMSRRCGRRQAITSQSDAAQADTPRRSTVRGSVTSTSSDTTNVGQTKVKATCETTLAYPASVCVVRERNRTRTRTPADRRCVTTVRTYARRQTRSTVKQTARGSCSSSYEYP